MLFRFLHKHSLSLEFFLTLLAITLCSGVAIYNLWKAAFEGKFSPIASIFLAYQTLWAGCYLLYSIRHIDKRREKLEEFKDMHIISQISSMLICDELLRFDSKLKSRDHAMALYAAQARRILDEIRKEKKDGNGEDFKPPASIPKIFRR